MTGESKRRDIPILGLGLGITANRPKGFAAFDTLRHYRGVDLRYVEIYPGAVGLPPYAGAFLEAWRADGVTTAFHSAGFDIWTATTPDESAVRETVRLARMLAPAWTSQDLMRIRTRGPRSGVMPAIILSEEAARVIARRHAACETALGRPLLLENAPYELMVGDLLFGEFFALLGDLADCGLTLDIGHAIGSAMLSKTDPMAFLDGFPFDRVYEIHVAGGRIEGTPPRYLDAHDAELLGETLTLFREIAPMCPNLRGVTYEVHSPDISILLDRLFQVQEAMPEDLRRAAPGRLVPSNEG